jgi:hypothetical protein
VASDSPPIIIKCGSAPGTNGGSSAVYPVPKTRIVDVGAILDPTVELPPGVLVMSQRSRPSRASVFDSLSVGAVQHICGARARDPRGSTLPRFRRAPALSERALDTAEGLDNPGISVWRAPPADVVRGPVQPPEKTRQSGSHCTAPIVANPISFSGGFAVHCPPSSRRARPCEIYHVSPFGRQRHTPRS